MYGRRRSSPKKYVRVDEKIESKKNDMQKLLLKLLRELNMEDDIDLIYEKNIATDATDYASNVCIKIKKVFNEKCERRRSPSPLSRCEYKKRKSYVKKLPHKSKTIKDILGMQDIMDAEDRIKLKKLEREEKVENLKEVAPTVPIEVPTVPVTVPVPVPVSVVEPKLDKEKEEFIKKESEKIISTLEEKK